MTKGELSVRDYKIIRGLTAFTVFTFIYFTTIFSVSPEERPIIVNNTIIGTDGGYNELIYIHTTPFFCLQIGIVALTVATVMDGIRSGYWRELDLPEPFFWGSKIFIFILALIVAFKIPYATNAMLGPAGSGDRWWEESDSMKTFAGIVDKGFLLFAALLPFFKVIYLLMFRFDKLEKLNISAVAYDREYGLLNGNDEETGATGAAALETFVE
eukprot:CAMPEP_0204861118 /NCGR_PEP_ID=MMETSP1348-20121228/1240_1 /ASSEMBLY_ACC=CAM_ASM_000700 /TAXON_ID=215587 /ORGANISM="Aplanochytrium stocchinoi, Strain GSBS06" /LENGTH=212 /DNA_ID=CAMNT_0052010305 /DNA_START=41 /DNA_END=679 /DNA_ORIENTATION=-